MSVLNAYILYKMKTGNKPQLGEFRVQIIREMIGKYGKNLPRAPPHQRVNNKNQLSCKNKSLLKSINYFGLYFDNVSG